MNDKLSVLVTTINRNNIDFVTEMNLECSAIVTNQNNSNCVLQHNVCGNKVLEICSTTKGVGKNRNLGILYCTSDYILFADDDVSYYKGYANQIINLFDKNPDVDMFLFGIDLVKNGEIYLKFRNKNKRIRLLNCLKYATYNIAVRKTSLEYYGVYFHTLFGGGCKYSAGEDSLFLLKCIRSGMNIQSNKYVLGLCRKDSSTWFRGYTNKYFYDKGVWLKCAFPHMPKLIAKLCFFKLCKGPYLKSKDSFRYFIKGFTQTK